MADLYEQARNDALCKPKLAPYELNMRASEYLEGYVEALCEKAMLLSSLEGAVYLEDLKEFYHSVSRAAVIIEQHLERLK